MVVLFQHWKPHGIPNSYTMAQWFMVQFCHGFNGVHIGTMVVNGVNKNIHLVTLLIF